MTRAEKTYLHGKQVILNGIGACRIYRGVPFGTAAEFHSAFYPYFSAKNPCNS